MARPCLWIACFVLCMCVAMEVAAAPAPSYARVALPPDGQTVLLMKFRTDGTSAVRNVLIADTNLNGTLEPHEKLVGDIPTQQAPSFRICHFPEFAVTCADGARHKVSAQVYLIRQLSSKTADGAVQPAVARDCYLLSLDTRISIGDRQWCYQTQCVLQPSPSETAPLVGARESLTLGLQTQPDKEKPGQTGFAVLLTWPALTLSGFTDGSGPGQINLRVTDQEGKVVHEATVPQQNLGFG